MELIVSKYETNSSKGMELIVSKVWN